MRIAGISASTIIISNFCFISQRARKLDKFGGKMTKFEDIGVDLNKVKLQLPWDGQIYFY